MKLDTQEASAAANGSPKVKKWLDEIADARKREKDFRKEGTRIAEIYEGEKVADNPFNILYSNTETLQPALYNNIPRPLVQRRFKDADPQAALVAKVLQRTLEFLIDPNDPTKQSFDSVMGDATLDALLPGRGVTRFRYEAEFSEVEGADEAGEALKGTEEVEESAEHEAAEQVTSETVTMETVPWDRFYCGYGRKWSDVPWIAFEHFMTREELLENFPEQGAAVKLTVSGDDKNGDDDQEGYISRPDDAEGVKFGHVYEIWDKLTKKVCFISPGFDRGYLKEVDDPLNVSGFYPMPEPLTFLRKITSMLPTPLYLMYEAQAKELNIVTKRITKIINALRVRGFYDSTLEGLDELMKQEDNSLMPAKNVAAMLQGQTLEKAIWLFPLEKLVAVLQQLYLQRGQIKEVIYEITGISDILRGASVASETATAQNIKNQWGTLRLKKMQKIVMNYVRECLRIMAEIAANKLAPETLSAMTGVILPTAQQKAQLQMAQQSAQASGQALPPQMLSMLALPTWEDLSDMLQNDLHRNYRIDIETNSTVDAEATEDKQNIGEFLNAVAQFMNGIAPMIEQGVMPFEAAKAILLAVTRRYRFGTEVEDQISAMQAPQPKDNGDAGKGQAEAQKAQAELSLIQAKTESEQALMKSQGELAQLEASIKSRELQQRAEYNDAKHALDMQKLHAETLAAAMTTQSPDVNNS